MGYCYHILAAFLDYHLNFLEKIQKQVHCITHPTFADSVALQKNILMFSVLVSFIDTLLEDAHLSWLNDI